MLGDGRFMGGLSFHVDLGDLVVDGGDALVDQRDGFVPEAGGLQVGEVVLKVLGRSVEEFELPPPNRFQSPVGLP